MKLLFRFFLLLFFTFTSCVKDIDFNQTEDFIATPEIKLALVNFNIEQTDLVIPGTNTEISGDIKDSARFTAFDNNVAQENLEKVILDFKVKNEFNRNFEIRFILSDENGNETYPSLLLSINRNDGSFTHTEEIIIANHPLFLQTKKIEAVLSLLPSSDGSTIDPSIEKKLQFQSGGAFHFKIN